MRPQLLLLLPAALCCLYGLLVFSVGSGTGFFLVWFALGAALSLCAVLTGTPLGAPLMQKLPPSIKLAVLVSACSLFLLFVFVEAMIVGSFRAEPEKGLDALIVAGAQVRENGPSVVLRYRLDTAAAYLAENPDTVCIVSGGRGPNEPFPEAEGMKAYLAANGIAPERILTEASSQNTRENMVFSSALLPSPDARVGIVTNDFHIFRAVRLAKKAGIQNASAVPAGSSALFLPNNLLREFFGVVKDFLCGSL